MNKALVVIEGFVIIVVTLTILLFTLYIVSPIVNDNVAKKTANELVEIPLPNNTEFIESIYEAGKLDGCGNGMQYFGAILIKSELSLDELKEYYAEFADNEWTCVVDNQVNSDVDNKIMDTTLTFKTDIEGNDYFIVYSWGDNNTIFDGFDLRGH